MSPPAFSEVPIHEPELTLPCSDRMRCSALPIAGADRLGGVLHGSPWFASKPSICGGQWRPGEVNLLMSEEDFDAALAQHAPRLIVLEASLTWCRPCKGFERPFEVLACRADEAACVSVDNASQ